MVTIACLASLSPLPNMQYNMVDYRHVTILYIMSCDLFSL